MKKINELLDRFDINIKKIDLIEESLTHSSYANEHHTLDNERLEFLGDSILNMLVAEFLYKEHKELSEGELSKLRARNVCEEANAEYARRINLGDYLRLGHGEELGGGRSRDAILNDAFEAFLGAVYLSTNLDKVRDILKEVVFPYIDVVSKKSFIDYKSKLQELVQAETREALQYREINESGRPHEKTFTMAVFLDGVKLGEGVGRSKKAAEQQAAKVALAKMVK